MSLFRREPTSVKVVVDEIDVDDALDKIRLAREHALVEIAMAARKLEAKMTEAKLERGRLESAVAAARTQARRGW